MARNAVRIGCGQGFWGDWLEAPHHLLADGDLDFLVLDYLAEVTMSVLAKQRERNPAAGYAKDFVSFVDRALPALLNSRTCVIANAGGMNPRGCAEAIAEILLKRGAAQVIKVAVVEGDDITPTLASFVEAGECFRERDSGREFSEVADRIVAANVYLGSEPIVSALEQGARIVVTGRVADPSLVLAPLVHKFRWGHDDWDRRAAGIVAGHIIECGAQSTGGNLSIGWEQVPKLAAIGYPIVEVSEDGSFVVTKSPGSGGCVSVASVTEQLLYEIGDPQRYITPDVIADFTSLRVEQAEQDVVRVTNARGEARPELLKVSMCYSNGYSTSCTLLYSWPDALLKAKAAGEIVRERLAARGVILDGFFVEFVGASACHGEKIVATSKTSRETGPEEVLLRIAGRDPSREKIAMLSREITPLVLNGPPGATAYFGSRGEVKEVYAFWPTLIWRSSVVPKVSLIDPKGGGHDS